MSEIADDQDRSKHQASVSMESSTDASVESGGDGGTGWFGSSLKDLTSLGRSLKDCIPPAIDGIADAIHRSVNGIAAEFSQMELDAESYARAGRDEQGKDSGIDGNESSDDENVVDLPLPWELYNDVSLQYEEDEDLKDMVMSLSLNEDAFQGQQSCCGTEDSVESDSYLDVSRVRLIRRLFNIDENLGNIHAKISGRSDIKETTFWKNYFHQCDRLRAEYELGAELVDTPTTCTAEGLSRPSTPPPNAKGCDIREQMSPPKVKSVGDLVLVGYEVDNLDELADELNRDSPSG